jgi:hypothetical protein
VGMSYHYIYFPSNNVIFGLITLAKFIVPGE